MKSLEELISRFNDIQDLPVSEEMLGAYAEGTLQGTELDAVSDKISSDSGLQEMLNSATETDIEDIAEAGHPWDIHEGDYGYWELGLPPILSPSDVTSEDNGGNIAGFSVDGDRISDENTLSIQNPEDSVGENMLNSSIMANNSRTIIYGEAGENISDPVYVQQPDDHSCALRSQQIVLRDFGIDIPFKDLEQIALENQVYTNEGTYTYDIGKVLQLAGVGMHQTEGNSIDDLINELAQGHRVIVSLDANELWYNNTISEKLRNWFHDVIGEGGNHALIVAGIEIDPTHPENNKVILTDPGAGHLRIEYPMEQFEGAWGDSNFFMAATNDPAPYQYDAETGMEVPSNFAVQQYVNEFVANNSYQLSPDLINVPEGYQPAFVGHLDVVGDVDYDTFKAGYDTMLSRRMPSYLTVKEQIEEAAKSHEGPDFRENKGLNTASQSSSFENPKTQSNSPSESGLSHSEHKDINDDDDDSDDNPEDESEENLEDEGKDNGDGGEMDAKDDDDDDDDDE